MSEIRWCEAINDINRGESVSVDDKFNARKNGRYMALDTANVGELIRVIL